jgi:lysophospholipase L1-like esterase
VDEAETFLVRGDPMARTRCTISSSSLATFVALALANGCSDDAAPTGSGGSEGDGSGGATTGMTGGGTQGADGTTAAATTMGGTVDDDSGGTPDDTGADSSGGDTGDMMGVACLDEQYVSGQSPVGNYSGFDVTIGSHCQGTNQQDITDIERIVFLGDSVTVGTPPTGTDQYYRNILAGALAAQFGLEPPEAQWEQVDVGNGTTILQESGAFASCAVWGARNDDLASQLESCFATEDYPARTLVVFTMGGNDGAAIAKDYLDGVPLADVLAGLDAMLADHEAAVQWLVGDPGKFPNGVFVVNANVYEFTDVTFDFLSCPTAALAGFDSSADMPDILLGSLQHINEEYMRIAEENGTDVVFMSEGFCGHGFHADDPAGPCYRGPDNATWFDLTCIHPTPAGHAALAEMFVNVISE